jgi:hypothetical protein
LLGKQSCFWARTYFEFKFLVSVHAVLNWNFPFVPPAKIVIASRRTVIALQIQRHVRVADLLECPGDVNRDSGTASANGGSGD